MFESIYFLKPAWCGNHFAGLWPEQGFQPAIRAFAFRRWLSLDFGHWLAEFGQPITGEDHPVPGVLPVVPGPRIKKDRSAAGCVTELQSCKRSLRVSDRIRADI